MDSLSVLRAEPSMAVFPAVAGVAGTIYMVVIMGGAVLLAFLLGQTLGSVAKAALYVYATEGVRPGQLGGQSRP